MQFRVEDFNFGVAFDVGGRNFTLAGSVNVYGLRTVAVDLDDDALQIQDNFRHVFLDAGNGRELMENSINFNGCNGITRERGQKDAAHAVSQRGAEASFQRLKGNLAISLVIFGAQDFNIGLLDTFIQFKTLLRKFKSAGSDLTARYYLE